MQPVKSASVAAILIGLTIAFALGQGFLSNRWSVPADLEQAGEHVRALPAEIGPWKLNNEGTVRLPTAYKESLSKNARRFMRLCA